jgi:acyl-coenzyme A synthetase/AMP-(fatty) acid ligase
MPKKPPPRRVQDLLAVYGDPRASVATLLCDRHPADAVAYTVVAPDLGLVQLTYGQLREESERFAAALAGLGVRPGDRVATLMGKSSEFLITVLGIWRLGAVHVPLFTAFAPAAIAHHHVRRGPHELAHAAAPAAQAGGVVVGKEDRPAAAARVSRDLRTAADRQGRPDRLRPARRRGTLLRALLRWSVAYGGFQFLPEVISLAVR